VDAYQYASWSDVRQSVRSQPEPLIVAVDHIEDPQNIGAIVRNAEGAGALAVLIPERRSASITPAARRAAAGAASHIKIASVSNLVRALDELKADGCWVTGLSLEAEAIPLRDADLSGKRVFVVGSEAKGLHRLVAEHCDALVRIPLLGKVGSLNAASAAAVVLFEAVRQRQTRGD
jgi:23S rRNA (guanosine2251-2'-O)-methyltransferase